ncbi:MAG: PH domain-containing protein [Phycisphaerae bacterium]|jgi:uncharacterized membrane protein YdbT with pleckstrin-like domain|nr:PH domain-containing protein [Phycisphaerae bacterium]
MVLLVFVRGCPILLPAALVLGIMQVRRKCIRYRITSQSISMEWGVFNRTGNEIPVSHVREIQMTQGLIERILDVGSLEFATAASGRQEIIFHGIMSPKSVRDLVRAQIR